MYHNHRHVLQPQACTATTGMYCMQAILSAGTVYFTIYETVYMYRATYLINISLGMRVCT